MTLRDVIFHLKRCLLIWLPRETCEATTGLTACSCAPVQRPRVAGRQLTCWATMKYTATCACTNWPATAHAHGGLR